MQVTDHDHGISVIDADYVRPGQAAIHLIVENGYAALVDTGTSFSVGGTMQVLADKHIAPEKVLYVLLTHVHLDHAGGAGAFMQLFPNAKAVVHPRGARHMADPSKLIAGTIAVYGETVFKQMYGEIPSIDAARIIEAADKFKLDFAGRKLLFLDTPGHARHHYCIWDARSQSLFAGDTLGVSFREFDLDANNQTQEFIFPTTTPVQFDPPALHASIDRLMGYQPRYAYLTHYGRIGNLPRNAAAMHNLIDEFVAVAKRNQTVQNSDEQHAAIEAGLLDLLMQRAIQHGCTLPHEKIRELLVLDVKLNAQGLVYWLNASA
jgi:glyoxylase-like metal-dependent hydrolase (beta-lactamase superfamily II)